MVVRDFPKWIVLLMNLAVIGVLYFITQAAKFAGKEICLGFLLGYFAFYLFFRLYYGWWPNFDENDKRRAN